MSYYEHFIQVCSETGLEAEYVREFLEYQIMTDFVITNTDRHFNNFGILRDTDTLKFVGMAPIFDSGNSMFWNCPNLLKGNDLLDIDVSSFAKKETGLLKYVKNPMMIDISKLPDKEDIRELIRKDIDGENKVDNILKGYR